MHRHWCVSHQSSFDRSLFWSKMAKNLSISGPKIAKLWFFGILTGRTRTFRQKSAIFVRPPSSGWFGEKIKILKNLRFFRSNRPLLGDRRFFDFKNRKIAENFFRWKFLPKFSRSVPGRWAFIWPKVPNLGAKKLAESGLIWSKLIKFRLKFKAANFAGWLNLGQIWQIWAKMGHFGRQKSV